MSKWTSFGDEVKYHRMWKEFVISESSARARLQSFSRSNYEKTFKKADELLKQSGIRNPTKLPSSIKIENTSILPQVNLSSLVKDLDNLIDSDFDKLKEEIQESNYATFSFSLISSADNQANDQAYAKIISDVLNSLEPLSEGLFDKLKSAVQTGRDAVSDFSTGFKGGRELDKEKRAAQEERDKINDSSNIMKNYAVNMVALFLKIKIEKIAAEKTQQQKAATNTQAQEKQKQLQQTLIGYGMKIAEANFPPQGGGKSRERERQRKKRREGAQFYFTLKSYVRQGRGFEVDEVSRRPLYPENATQEEQAALKLVLRGYLKFIEDNNIKIEGPTGPKL